MNEFSNVSWPGWEVVRKIGNGSFGSVYEIQRDVFGDVERAALKVITIPQSRSDIDELLNEGYDEASVTERFRGYLQDIAREYSLMAKMKGHTNVVYCDDIRYVQHDDGIGWDIYIKMELLTPMMNTLSNDIPEETAVRVGMDICSALVLCRQQNIVHRDIKPQNIFVSANGEYKLGDFGIAKTAEKTTGGTKIGTYKYMAPEVYNNQPYGAAADIYSLGIVLYWLLNCRRTPFLPLPPQTPSASIEEDARRRRFAGEPIPAPAHGSPELQAIVMKACAYNMRDRYSTPDEMLADLKALASGKKPSAPIVRPAPAAAPAGDDERTVSSFNHVAHSEEATVGAFASKHVTVDTEATVGQWSAPPKKPEPKKEAPKPAPVAEKKPAPKQPEPKKEELKKEADGKKKPWILYAGIGAAVLALILVLVLVLGGGDDKPEANNGDSSKPQSSQGNNNENSDPETPTYDTTIEGGEDLFGGERFEEMIWGYYEAVDYNYTGSGDDAKAFLEDMEYIEISMGGETYEFAALPLSIQSGQFSHSVGSVYYDGDYYEPYTEKGKAMFRKAWIEQVGDLTEEQFLNMEETFNLHVAELYVVDRMGNTRIFSLAYKFENGKLAMYNCEIDDNYRVTLDSTPVVTYDVLLDGGKLALKYKGVQRDYVGSGYKEDDSNLYFEGYALNEQNRYGDIEGFSFFQYGHDEEPSVYVYLTNGDSPADETITFDYKTGEFTLSWTERWTTYNGNTVKEADNFSVSGKLVPCTTYPSDGHGGMFLFIDGQRYDYLMSSKAYEETQYSDILSEDVVIEDLSTSDLDAINAAKNSILEDLKAAFAAAGINAEIDPNSGKVTLESSFLFATNSAELSAEGQAYLNGVLDVYTAVLMSDAYSGYISSIMIEGHTDTAGSYSSNQVLSEQRAASVANHCLSRTPALSDVIQTKGCSYDYPIYNADGTVDMASSRRVTFRFILAVG